MENKYNQDPSHKEWLDKLQENSWNLELLISAFAIYGLIQGVEKIFEFDSYLKANHDSSDLLTQIISNFMNTLGSGLVLFTIFLICHVFFRGLWIAAIGLRYVSGGINYDNLNYSHLFTSFLKKKVGDYDNFILKLEKISSSLFAVSYLTFFILLSMIIYIMFCAGIAKGFYVKNSIAAPIFSLLLLVLGLIVGFDFITLGLLKRIKIGWISRSYFWLYRMVSTITLSFLWRPLLYNFIDRKKIRLAVVFSVPFVFLLSFIGSFRNNTYEYFPSLTENSSSPYRDFVYKEEVKNTFISKFYDDELLGLKAAKSFTPIKILSIKSRIIRDKYLEVFVKYDGILDKYLPKNDSTIFNLTESGFTNGFSGETEYKEDLAKRQTTLDKENNDLRKQNPKQARKSLLSFFTQEQKVYNTNINKIINAIKQAVRFKINDILVPSESMDYSFMIHDNLSEKGVLVGFPLDSIRQGTNYITIIKKNYVETTEEFEDLDFTIPFVYINKD